MEKPKYTADGMPVITEETYKSLQAIMAKSKPEIFGKEFHRRLDEENPLVQRTLSDVLSHYGRGKFFDGAAFGICFTYELIRRQIASNRLQGDLEGKKY